MSNLSLASLKCKFYKISAQLI